MNLIWLKHETVLDFCCWMGGWRHGVYTAWVCWEYISYLILVVSDNHFYRDKSLIWIFILHLFGKTSHLLAQYYFCSVEDVVVNSRAKRRVRPSPPTGHQNGRQNCLCLEMRNEGHVHGIRTCGRVGWSITISYARTRLWLRNIAKRGASRLVKPYRRTSPPPAKQISISSVSASLVRP